MKPNNFWACWIIDWNTAAVLMLEGSGAGISFGFCGMGMSILISSCLVKKLEKKEINRRHYNVWTTYTRISKIANKCARKISLNCMSLANVMSECIILNDWIRDTCTCTCTRIVTCKCNGHMTLTCGWPKFSPNLSTMGYNWAMIASTVGLLFESTTRQTPKKE